LSEANRKYTLYWTIVIAWVAIDVVTKAWAETALAPQRIPHEIVGNAVRFTLVYNQGAAFGMHIGEWSRWIFMALTVGALIMLAHLLRETRSGDVPRTLALSLVTAGAIGNLIDRIRSSQGVVDFIDIGTPGWRFWTFNVADIGVSCGAILLAIVLWREERQLHAMQAEARQAEASTTQPSQSSIN
jgi:signal peptidase II